MSYTNLRSSVLALAYLDLPSGEIRSRRTGCECGYRSLRTFCSAFVLSSRYHGCICVCTAEEISSRVGDSVMPFAMSFASNHAASVEARTLLCLVVAAFTLLIGVLVALSCQAIKQFIPIACTALSWPNALPLGPVGVVADAASVQCVACCLTPLALLAAGWCCIAPSPMFKQQSSTVVSVVSPTGCCSCLLYRTGRLPPHNEVARCC